MTLNKNFKKALDISGKFFRVVGMTFLCIFLILVITITIVGTAMVAYILQYVNDTETIDLDLDPMGFTTFVYADGETEDEYVQIGTLTTGSRRVWVDLEQIPQYVRDAFVASEDERFYDHNGVDFKRTIASFINEFVFRLYDQTTGGSTITQQVIKNAKRNFNDRGVEAKIEEIFGAISLEKNYTKDDILEYYLNIVDFSNLRYGVQAASDFYFDKDVSQLTIAEASIIAAMTKNPTANNPIGSAKQQQNNLERRTYILKTMLETGCISSDEFWEAVNEDVVLVGFNKVDEDGEKISSVTSYYYDSAVEQAIEIFMEKYNLPYKEAEGMLKAGGYNIYTNMDTQIQTELEKKYKDPKTFASNEIDDPPQATAYIQDYKGNILGIVGGIGEKDKSRIMNRADESPRPPGSTIKPIASYGPAIYYDLITWSTIINDTPVEVMDYSTGKMVKKHKNYDGVWSKNNYFINYHLRKSLNTGPTHIINDLLGVETSFDFLVNTLHISSLEKSLDCYISPLSIGSFSRGITLKELTASYQIFGNGGKYYEPTYIKRITDANGMLIYEHKYEYTQAIDPQTAYVMNRLLAEVTTESLLGTGRRARDGLKVDVVGKTGTSDNYQDISFIACTPEYVSGIWYGYDSGNKSTQYTYDSSARVWNSVFKDIMNRSEITEFTPDPNVRRYEYCTKTGLLACPFCEKTAYGYYKTSNVPGTCSEENHIVLPESTAPSTEELPVFPTFPETSETTEPSVDDSHIENWNFGLNY